MQIATRYRYGVASNYNLKWHYFCLCVQTVLVTADLDTLTRTHPRTRTRAKRTVKKHIPRERKTRTAEIELFRRDFHTALITHSYVPAGGKMFSSGVGTECRSTSKQPASSESVGSADQAYTSTTTTTTAAKEHVPFVRPLARSRARARARGGAMPGDNANAGYFEC